MFHVEMGAINGFSKNDAAIFLKRIVQGGPVELILFHIVLRIGDILTHFAIITK